MDLHWTSLLVVAAVFTAFSGTASVWGRLQRRRRVKQEAVWQALLSPEGGHDDQVRRTTTVSALSRPARQTLPPDPSFADSPSFVSDSDSRRAALDEALDRMSRQAPAPASNNADWEDTEPSVTLSTVLPHTAGRRGGSEAA
jgi:hypothetical protein